MSHHQISLFEEQQGNFSIKKHSALAQMNNITSLVQRKAMNAILRIAKDELKRNPDQTYFEIDLWILKRLAGVFNNNNTQLKQGLKSLVSLVIEYNILKKDSYEWGAFPFLSFVKIKGEKRWKTATLGFSLSPPILESVIRPEVYVKLNLFLQRGFKSKYSLSLFEVLMDYKGIKKLRIELEQLRKLLGIEPAKYSVFAMFRKKVLDIAMREINGMTPLQVSYSLEKTGKKYTAVVFRMSWQIQEPNKQEVKSQITKKLKFYGFNDNHVKELLQNHDEDYLMANVAVVEEDLEKGKNIKNVKAYLAKGFKVDYSPPDSQYEKKKLIEKEKHKDQILQTEENKKQSAILRKQFEKEKKENVIALLEKLSSEEKEQLKEEFFTTILQNPIFEKLFQNKWFDSPLIQQQRFTFLAKKYLAKIYQSFENYSRSKMELEDSMT